MPQNYIKLRCSFKKNYKHFPQLSTLTQYRERQKHKAPRFSWKFWLHIFPAASQKLGLWLPCTWELMWHIVSSSPEASVGVWEHECIGTSCVFPSLFSPAIEQTFPIFPWNDFVYTCSIPTTATRESDSHVISYLELVGLTIHETYKEQRRGSIWEHKLLEAILLGWVQNEWRKLSSSQFLPDRG